MGQPLCRLTGRAFQVQLQLSRFLRIRQKGDAPAIGRPGKVAFRVRRSRSSGDPPRRSFSVDRGCKDRRISGLHSAWVAKLLYPRHFLPVGRKGYLVKRAGLRQRSNRFLQRKRVFFLLYVAQPLFDSLLRRSFSWALAENHPATAKHNHHATPRLFIPVSGCAQNW